MTNKTIHLLWIITTICFLYVFFINTYYRPYIYKNEILDFGIADIGNNIVIIPFTYFLTYLLRRKFIFSDFKDILFQFLILSGLEVLSVFVSYIGTFDFNDIIGLLLGAFLTYIIMQKLNLQ